LYPPIKQELVKSLLLLLSSLLLLRGKVWQDGDEIRTYRHYSNSQYQFFRRLTVKLESLNDLYLDQLQDLYNAEQQLIKALPKMAKAAASEELRAAFEKHLEKTREHALRIESICEQMGEKADGKKCKAMEGLVKEGDEVISEDAGDKRVKDAALIAAAQRVEHYEIAGYGCVRAYATKLGDTPAADVLGRTLDEEKEADTTLNGIAEKLNFEIAGATEASASAV
jgi:ferritin-like metal-binding protein YciE